MDVTTFCEVGKLLDSVNELIGDRRSGFIIAKMEDIGEHPIQFIVDEMNVTDDFIVQDLMEKLPKDHPRFVFFRYFVEHEAGWGDFYDIVIRYIPRKSRIKEKMIYAASCSIVRKKFERFKVVDLEDEDISEGRCEVTLRDMMLIQPSRNLIKREDYTEIGKQERERLSYIQKYCDLKIILQNSTILFWKSFLCHSNIRNLSEISEYDVLKDVSLNITSEVLFYFITNRQVEIRKLKIDHLRDYFTFFRHLGMKDEMMKVLRQLERIDLSYNELYELLMKHGMEETILRNTSPENTDPVEDLISLNVFPTSFSLFLFSLLIHKCNEKNSEVDENSEFVTHLKGDTFRNLKTEDAKKFILSSHPDFTDYQRQQESFSFLRRLHKDEDGLCNLTLKTVDGSEIGVHREVLVWRSNFFHLMLKFEGTENREMENNGTITLLELKERETKLLLEFYYTSEIKAGGTNHHHKDDEDDLEVCLIHCINHLDMFLEKGGVGYFIKCVVDVLTSKYENMKIEDVKKVLQEVKNEEIRERIEKEFTKKNT